MLGLLFGLLFTPAYADTCPAAPYGPTEIKNYQTVQVCHINYLSEYNVKFHLPMSVNWVVTKDELNNCNIRKNAFSRDPLLNGQDVSPRDYVNSNYDKGHLSPAEDNLFSPRTEDESFYMSNMTPQVPEFNRDGWKYFEQLTREYAFQYGKVIVWAGPVIDSDKMIKDEIAVPDYFWKVVYIPSINKTISIYAPNKQIRGDEILQYLSSPEEIEIKAGITIPLPENVNKSFMGDNDDVITSAKQIRDAKTCQ